MYHWYPSSCHPTAGTQREQVQVGESMCGFPKRNCLGVQQPPPLTQSPLVLAARSCGVLPSWHWNPGLGVRVWVWNFLFPRYPSWIFIHVGWGQPLLWLRASYQSPWVWFLQFYSCHTSIQLDTVVVRLQGNSISDIPEWWLLYILVVILMWLCEEASHVCLCCHLDWKPEKITIILSAYY